MPFSAGRTPARRSPLSSILVAAVVGVAVTCATRWAASAFVGKPHIRACIPAHLKGGNRQSGTNLAAKSAEECKVEEENPMSQIKSLGVAGAISYALWELAFWAIGGGGAVAAYLAAKGHMPDFSNQEELAEVTGEAFIFINGARFLVPLRIGLAVSTTPFIRDNLVNKFTRDPECVDVEELEKEAQREKQAVAP